MRGRLLAGAVLLFVALVTFMAGVQELRLGGADRGPALALLLSGLGLGGLGGWLWWVGRKQPVDPSPKPWKRVAALIGGTLLLAFAYGAWTLGEFADVGAFAVFGVLAFAYAVVARDSRAPDTEVRVLDLPTGPERGLLIVQPRTKRAAAAIAAPLIGAAVIAFGLGLRADGVALWWSMVIFGIAALGATWPLARRARGVSGIGLTTSGLSFVQPHGAVLVPWAQLADVAHESTTHGHAARSLRVVIRDRDEVIGDDATFWRMVSEAPDGEGVVVWPIASFDLLGPEIVSLIERYRRDPARRAELTSLQDVPSG